MKPIHISIWLLSFCLLCALLSGCAIGQDGIALSSGTSVPSSSGEVEETSQNLSSSVAVGSPSSGSEEPSDDDGIAKPVLLAAQEDYDWWNYDETIDADARIYWVRNPEKIYPHSPYTEWPADTPYYIVSERGVSNMMNLPAYEGLSPEAGAVHVCVILSFGKDLSAYEGPGYEAPHFADCMLLRAFADDGSDPDLLFDVTGSGELLLGREALAEQLVYDDGAVVVYDILPYVQDRPTWPWYAAGGFEAEVSAYAARIEAGEEPVSLGWEEPYDPAFSLSVRDDLIEQIPSLIGPMDREDWAEADPDRVDP